MCSSVATFVVACGRCGNRKPVRSPHPPARGAPAASVAKLLLDLSHASLLHQEYELACIHAPARGRNADGHSLVRSWFTRPSFHARYLLRIADGQAGAPGEGSAGRGLLPPGADAGAGRRLTGPRGLGADGRPCGGQVRAPVGSGQGARGPRGGGVPEALPGVTRARRDTMRGLTWSGKRDQLLWGLGVLSRALTFNLTTMGINPNILSRGAG